MRRLIRWIENEKESWEERQNNRMKYRKRMRARVTFYRKGKVRKYKM